ncbi:MAG: hypothetical protein J7K23_05700 [Thermoproteales archaeon]|nr:hypothetical protein [Thermoproteales archaeon]
MKPELDRNKIGIIIGIIIIVSFIQGIQSYTSKITYDLKYKVLELDKKICSFPKGYVLNSSQELDKILDNPNKYNLRIATREEKIIVCLGDYTNILEEKTWKEDNIKVVVFRVSEGQENKYILIDVQEDLELYVMITNNSGEFLVPLIKKIPADRIIEFKGRTNIKNLTTVKIYAYPASIDFNKTHTPSENFYLTEVKINKGEFWIRLDSKLIPVRFKGTNMPNQWILIYGLPYKGGYKWFKIDESIGKTQYVILTLEENN